MRQAGAALLAVVLALGLASCGEPTRVEAGKGDAVGASEPDGQTTTTSEWRSDRHELECTPNETYLWSHNADILESGIDRADPEGASPESAIRRFVGWHEQVKPHRLGDEVPVGGITNDRKPIRGFYRLPSDMPEVRRYGYSRGNRLQMTFVVNSYDGYWITTGADGCHEGITE